MEGDGVALGAGHRLLVVAAAAGRSRLPTLQSLPVDCGLLLTSLMRVGGMRKNDHSRENLKMVEDFNLLGVKGGSMACNVGIACLKHHQSNSITRHTNRNVTRKVTCGV